MRKNEFIKKTGAAAAAAGFMLSGAAPVMAAGTLQDAAQGTANTADNSSVTNNELQLQNLVDKDRKGSFTIFKYDQSSAEHDGYKFTYSDTDDLSAGNATPGVASKLTRDRQGGEANDATDIDISATGQTNKAFETEMAPYTIAGVEFTYLRVADVKQASQIDYKEGDNGTPATGGNGNSYGITDGDASGINRNISLLYGLDSADKATVGTGTANEGQMSLIDILGLTEADAVTKEGNIWYYTSKQINDALKANIDRTVSTAGSYATAEAIGDNDVDHKEAADRIDGTNGIRVKDLLHDFIIAKRPAANTSTGGKVVTDKDGKAVAGKDGNNSTLDLGLYLIVETAVPENVTDTCNPFFVQVPMTNLANHKEGTEGAEIDAAENWIYDLTMYPKNQTGHPTLDKMVRNAYGSEGRNIDSAGANSRATGENIYVGDTYQGRPGQGTDSEGDIAAAGNKVITDADKNGKSGTKYDMASAADQAAWLNNEDKLGDYQYGDTCTASEGDVLDFILVSKLPRVTDKTTYLTEYEFIDTLSKGLSLDQKTVRIAIYNDEAAAKVNDSSKAITIWTPVNAGTVGADDPATKQGPATFNINQREDYLQKTEGRTGAQSINIALTAKGLSEVNTKYYDGNHYMVVYYQATVDSNAETVLGDVGNPNDVSLIWKRTSEGYYNTLEDRSVVYTYAIDFTKYFNDKGGDFSKVQFKLYNETEDYYVVARQEAPGKYFVTGKVNSATDNQTETQENRQNSTTFVPDNNGKLIINGIEADEYKLIEIQTDKGYSLLENPIDIVITPTSQVIVPSAVHYMTRLDDKNNNSEMNADGSLTQNGTAHPDGRHQLNTDAEGKESTTDKKFDLNYTSGDTNALDTRRTIILSDGSRLGGADVPNSPLEEGTTARTYLSLGEVTPATAQVDGKKAEMRNDDANNQDNFSVATGAEVQVTSTVAANTIDNGQSKDAAVMVSAVNSKGFKMVNTGGQGTKWLMIAGIAAIAGAVGIKTANKKKVVE